MSTELEQKASTSPSKRASKTSTAKRKSAKKVTASTAAKKPSTTTTKKKVVKKKAAAKRAVSAPIIMPNPAKRQTAIEKIAYHLSEARGFTPGFEERDWLTAETIIEQLHRED